MSTVELPLAAVPAAAPLAVDWREVDLVVFDVDGTLYDQKRLRLAMLCHLLAHAWRARDLGTLLTLRTFRKVRETLGDKPVAAFIEAQYAQTAARHGKTPEQVRLLATEWLEERPLPLLASCRYPQVQEVFAGLRERGKKIAIFSDYPAARKLEAMGLQADHVVCATDSHIARLKPDPAALLEILRLTGVSPHRTLMIGDRADRDGMAAQRAGVRALIRASRPRAGFATFQTFADPVFQPLLRAPGPAER